MKDNFGKVFCRCLGPADETAMANFRPFSTAGAYGMASVLWNTSGSGRGNGPRRSGANVTSFTRRQTNLWSYARPTGQAFQGSVAYSGPTKRPTGYPTG